MSSLDVVALLSGGKDSTFSMLHCLANGHRIVALANLHPADNVDDSDSFMYQTIGHRTLPLFEQVFALPLYRRAISGTAVNKDRSYGHAQRQDEVEDMTALLQTVIEAHPTVKAVCTGAILSDYQRTRVESVATRLGLTSLSFLWHFPMLPPYFETTLLSDMAAVGQDARIIKVASGGLDETALWQNVADGRFYNKTVARMARYGALGVGAALGEGGEYETLAISGPTSLWKGRIEVDDSNIRTRPGEAGSASVSLAGARAVMKQSAKSLETEVGPRIPPVFDDKFASIRDSLSGIGPSSMSNTGDSIATAHDFQPWQKHDLQVGRAIYNVISTGDNAAAQTTSIMQSIMTFEAINPDTIVASTIILRDMSDFAAVNAAYSAHFAAPNPPARVTIACGHTLPEDVLVSISIVALDNDMLADKQGLHVQSRSYWAPANIGPYSQAITYPTKTNEELDCQMVAIAGQIPLHPASMDVYQPSKNVQAETAADQVMISLQHMWRIGDATRVNIWLGSVACLSTQACKAAHIWVHAASDAWTMAHTDHSQDTSDVEQDVDVWDIRNRVSQPQPQPQKHDPFATIQTSFVPPFFAVEVEELPRAVNIEWCSTGFRHSDGKLHRTEIGKHTKICLRYGDHDTVVAGYIAVFTLSDIEQFKGIADDSLRILYSTAACQSPDIAKLIAQRVPCRRIWDAEGSPLLAVLAYRCA